MAKILQFVHMIWGFIRICFLKFWTYLGRGQTQRCELGDMLKWQREEITKLQEVLKAEQVLNKKQCTNLLNKLEQIVHCLDEMMLSTKETSNKFGLVLEELCCITRKVRVLVQDCGKQEWCHVAAFQMNNTEAFRELVDDLKCLWDALCERYSAIYSNSQIFRFPCIDFNVATYDEIESDELALQERLYERLQTLPNDSEDFELAKHLLRRLRFEWIGVKGGESDAIEVSKDFIKPVFSEMIGIGATSNVYKSSWLGLQSATKILKVLPDFGKEVGILACFNHPNLVRFFFCGEFIETHEENFDGSNNVSRIWFLVMELMEMSLSDLLKNQRTPLPYLAAIDIMHKIARGMCYLHDMHCAHLDLKPSNVLLSSMPRLTGVERNIIGYDFVKLINYDTLKREVQRKLELEEHTIGTTRYMALEMYNKKEKDVTCPFQADVWSFAMTCSEILSLEEPFLDTNLKDILQKIKDCFRPKLPINCKELTMLIEECWVEDPSQRPTFFDICERLVILKKKFMVGTYSNEIPEFDEDGTLSPNMQLKAANMNISTSKKVDERPHYEVVVGLESKLTRVRNQLKQANILGLIGMGGIGKTTLAKNIFVDVRSTYDASCFIENMKSKSSLEILCKILQNFGRDKETLKSLKLMDAQKTMSDLLATKKVLLILDDPIDANQLLQLIPIDVAYAKNGTKIIITTRHWDVIENCVDVNGRIDVDMLDEDATKILFDSFCVVDGAQLSPKLFDLRGKIIEMCKGLPLSLKVMGAYLRGTKRIQSWERACQRMKRGRCLDGDEGVQSTLRISFDELGNDEKNMFLDIACFFPMGMEKKRALHIPTNYGTSPGHVLNILLDKSLINIDQEGFLEMHDQLRDMGQMIVETNQEYLGTRIWKPNKTPLGIGSQHKKIYNKIKAMYLNEEILQWLLDNYKGMKDLDVSSLRLLICWKLTTIPKGLESLTSLTTLYLIGCSSLTTLLGVGDLTSLTTLDLSGCSSLTILPEGLGNLTSLATLYLCDCSTLTTLPEGVGNLTSLTTLDLSRCLRLTTLPEVVGNLISLTTLDLSGCSSLTTLPEGLGNLVSLTTLHLFGCSSLITLPMGVGNLTSLTSLDLSGCLGLRTLSEALGNLLHLSSKATCLETINMDAFLIPDFVKDGTAINSNWNLVTSRDLKSLTMLGRGLSGIVYETMWEGVRYARKDFLRVDNNIFEAEARVLLGLHHPNIVKTYCWIVDKRSCSLVLEYMDDDLSTVLQNRKSLKRKKQTGSVGLSNTSHVIDLQSFIHERKNLIGIHTRYGSECIYPFELSEALHVILEIAKGMQFLHGQQVVHGDIKPNNILITDSEGVISVKLTDFGLLRTKLKSRLASRKVRKVNLVKWKAPELFAILLGHSINDSNESSMDLETDNEDEMANDPKVDIFVDTKLVAMADVYSFGVTCSQILTGEEPYPRMSLKELLNGISSGSLRPELPPTCPPLLKNLLYESWGEIHVRPTFSKICKVLEQLQFSALAGSERVQNLTSLTILNLSGCLSLTTLPEGLGNLTSLVSFDLSKCSSLKTLPEGVGNLISLTTLSLSRCLSLTTLPDGLGNLIFLITLDLFGCSSLTTLPEGLGNLTSLTTLNLSHCLNLTTLSTGLGNLISLTTLYLSGCSSLTTLSDGVRNLMSLTTLDLSGCSSLTTLPTGLGNLISLTTLDLSGCSSLTTLPEGLGNLISLTTLDLSSCSSLTTLPKGLGNLISLTTLFLYGCSSLTTLLDAAEHWTSLTTLDLSSCSSLTTLADGVGNLNSLTTLYLHGCSSLTTLPEALGNLTSLITLNLFGCFSLTTLPEGLGNLTSLTTLNLSHCWSLTTLPNGVGNLISLTTLDLFGCSSLTTLQKGVGNLISLKTLYLSSCSSLTTLPNAVENLTSFTTLDLSGCLSLKRLPEGLGNLTSLTTLNLSHCWSLTTLPDGVGNLISLTTLDLSRCSSLTTLPEGLGNLTSLTTLNLSRCKILTTLPDGVGNLTSLATFDLSGCSSLTTLLEGLEKLTSLTTLKLSHCLSLTTLPKGLGNLISLTILYVSGCLGLITLPDGVGNLISLTTLYLYGCSSLTTLPDELGNLTSLTILDLSSCSRLTTLPEGLGNLTSLTILNLCRCLSLTTLPKGLGKVISLTTLNLSRCFSLTKLPDGVGNLISLTTLDLSDCSSLTTLPEGVMNLISLSTLYLHDCLSLTTLPDGLRNLTSLTTLNLSRCSRLTTLPDGVENLISLTTLDLSGCSSLTILPHGVTNLTSLSTLYLYDCSSLTKLPDGVGNLTSFTTLDLSGCSSLTTLPEGLGNLTSLTTLNLSRCLSLKTLPEGVGNLISLTTLDLSGCSSLTTLPHGVMNLTSLSALYLYDCSSLTKLPDGVGNLIYLTTLDLSGCSSLTTLPEGVMNLTSLSTLYLYDCLSLTRLPDGVGNLISLTSLLVNSILLR